MILVVLPKAKKMDAEIDECLLLKIKTNEKGEEKNGLLTEVPGDQCSTKVGFLA
jgi:hypothetical protein